jgi:hypothetical protein
MLKSGYGYTVRLSIIFLMIAFVLTAHRIHPHYVGITELEYLSSKQELQISCKWFIDDMEDALKAYSGKKYDITNNPDIICNDSIVQAYIRSHIKLTTDKYEKKLLCVGSEIEKGAVWVYWKAENMNGYKTLEFYNNLFCEIHTDQMHLIHYKISGKRETKKVSCKNPLALFK